MPNPNQTVIPAGFVRSYRGNSASQQEQELRDYGVTTIYNADEKETPENAKGKFRRRGEVLGVYGGLRALGEKRSDVVAAVEMFREKGIVILDILTGERSDVDGVAMLSKAWKTFNAEVRVPDLEKASAYGKLGGRVKGEKAKEKRMKEAEAGRIWMNKKLHRSVSEALEHMPGWSRASAYTHLGDRDDVSGRRKKLTT